MAGQWIQDAVARMKEKGTIGSFKKAAKQQGMSTMPFARQTKNSPSASPAMKKKATFALNVGGK
jgi:hypothetical protein